MRASCAKPIEASERTVVWRLDVERAGRQAMLDRRKRGGCAFVACRALCVLGRSQLLKRRELSCGTKKDRAC